MTASDVRTAHKLLDRVSQGRAVLEEEISLLRSFLPELPAQKTLEEITELVNEAWGFTHVNEWDDDAYGSLESWLSDLETQLQGVKETSANVPALPAGMRLADHAEYGRVVTSPKPDQDGVYVLLISTPKVETGADWEYVHECELTFVDAEPAAPAHPEFLETEGDYENAPEGTVVARDSLNPWVKEEGVWMQGTTADATVYRVPCLKGTRRVLRWGGK